MRRLIVLGAGLTIMWGLRGLPTAAGEGGADPLTLAAIGFVLLAAFTVGELGAQLGLPKVTGYIVAGVALGPQAADILSMGVVGEMRVFNTLALGLIATAAGLELDLKAIARVWKVLTAVVLLKLPLLVVLVGGAFIAVETVRPSLGLPPEAIAPIALVVAILGIGTSPAIALAVVNGGRAKGRLTDLLLAIAVVKDLVVVVCLAIALALAKAMLDPSAHLDAHVLIHVAEELGGSIAVGAVLGGLLVLYMRFVHKQMLLFVLLTILVVAEVSATLHLELLLVFIVAGFLVRNLSDYEHNLMEPIERISLPVFVVFFTTAGAGVDLAGTLALLPLALTVVVARLVAYYIAGRVGGAIGGEGPAVVDNAWLTWIPQAGVTLGLVLLAAKAIPELSTQITSIGMALVAIHLLIGPVTMGIGLTRAGEMGKGKAEDPHHDAHGAESLEHRDPTEEVSVDVVEELTEAAAVVPRRSLPEIYALVGDLVVREELEDLVVRIQARMDDFVEQVARPSATELVAHANARLPDRDEDLDGLLDNALSAAGLDHGAWLGACQALYQDIVRDLQSLPESVHMEPQPAPADHLERAEKWSRMERFRAGSARLFLGRSRREPGYRMIGREALEARLAVAVREVSEEWYRTNALVYEQLAAGAGRDGAAARTAVAEAAREWLSAARTLLDEALHDGIAEMAEALVEHASPLGKPRLPRYSRVEAAVAAARAGLRTDDALWKRAVGASSDHSRLASILAVLKGRTEELHQSWGQAALDSMERELLASVDAAVDELRQMQDEVQSDRLPVDVEACEERMKRVFPLNDRVSLRLAAQTFRQGTQPDRLNNALVALLERLPERLRVALEQVSTASDVRDVDSYELEVARQVRTLLLDARVPEMCRSIEALTPQLVSCHTHLAEGVEVASYGLAVAARDGSDPKGAAIESLGRSASRLTAYRTDIVGAITAARESLAEEQLQTETELSAMLTRRTGVARVASGMVATGRILRSRADVARRWLVWSAQFATAWLQARLDDPALADRAIRLGHRRLDSEQIRARVQDMVATQIPSSVAGLYSDRAVDDRRQFVAHRTELDRLRSHLANPDPVTPLLALVIGDRGSGRTSMINVIQLSARKLQVVRPEDAYHDRTTGVLSALARELRCDVGLDPIRDTLALQRTLVLLDNLERFMAPTAAGVADLDNLLQLASTTAKTGTQWVVTVEASVLARLEQLTTVRALFNQQVHLHGCDGQVLLDVMGSRARLGGYDLAIEPIGSRVERLVQSPEELCSRALARESGGNLAAAMAAWRGALTHEGERVLSVGPIASRELPFFGQLPDLARAAMGALHAWGPMERLQLSGALGVHIGELSTHIQLLAAAGLVVHTGPRMDELGVPTPLLEPVQRELLRARQTARSGP